MDDADIDGLQYPVSQPCDANGDPQPDVLWDVPKLLKAYLHGIRGYVYHQETVLKDPVTLSNCILIDPDDFDTYRASSAFIVFCSRTIPQPLVSKPSRCSPAEEFDRGIHLDANLYPTLSNNRQWDSPHGKRLTLHLSSVDLEPDPIVDPETKSRHGTPEEFDWGIKLDANLYPTLSDDKQWDSYRPNLEATCRTHGLTQVLDPKYQPISLDERDLFDRHQSFLYQVFVRTLLTDQGKKIVRQYNKTYDAQCIYRDLCKFYTQSIMATSTANTKLQWLTTAQLTADRWLGSHVSFILHWLHTLRQYHKVAKHTTPEEQLIVMLSNAVRLVPYLRNVFDSSKQVALQNNNRPLTFDEYASLLEAAAQNHDEVTKGTKPKADPRKAYATDVVTTGDLEPDPGPPMFDFQIDMILGDYYAYCTSLSSARKTFFTYQTVATIR
ncbi:unnamed protein product [Cylindrotheca closterium]|uniref:Uncharacterized protein n=1 Tax=Cylindrotheca closterium TaxID=2856 RepID=A0AAD2FPR5_9STRA|nr:unnamed protein product [Cylindrotheca closterium]